ncbi:hypothetical protein QYF36_018623 [Acer negundo]|nr:hypothetical protein QYF36_018623 [Acer negundo]
MEGVALASLLRVTLQNLASPIVEEFGLLWGVNDELEKLGNTLSMIQAVLEDASKWQNQGKAVGVWLARLEDVAYDADDILDEFATVAKLRDVATRSQSSKTYKLRRFLSSLDPSKIIFRHDMAHVIKKIRKTMDDIGKDAFNLLIRESNGWRAHEVRRELSTSAFTDLSKIVGRHYEKEHIVSFLAVDPLLCNPPLRIFSIVGVGGLGKTTLAQLVYNDLRMQRYFDLRIWIYVSQIFDATQLAKAIIESITWPQEQMQLNALQVILANLLYNRRYLLVLDNVCDDSNNAKDEWNKLLVQLTMGAAGSTIIVTTRNQTVASNMAQSISVGGHLRVQDAEMNNTKKTRHLSICDKVEQGMFKASLKSKNLRTFLLLHQRGGWFEQVPSEMFNRLKRLRVLGLNNIFQIRKLPNSVGDMMHLSYELGSLQESIGNLTALQYVDLSNTQLRALPESIGNLCHLQTLKIESCLLFQLPRRTGDLVNLQHLYVNSCRNLLSMPEGIGRLTSLQTLSSFVVGRAPGCGLHQLNSLNNLRGKLHISRLENATNLEEYNLKNKPYISELQLEWSNTYRSNIPRDGEAENELLESLQPHTNLTKLEVNYYSGTELPSWLGNHLFSYLTTVRLYECRKWREFPPFGQLPSLKYLEIDRNDEVEYMDQEFSGEGDVKGFPSLEELSISDMSNLEEWVSVGENEYPSLKKLTIYHCDKLRTMPYQLSGVTTMKLSGCQQLNALPMLPNIRELELIGCGENAIKSLTQLTSLVSLKIYFPDINSLPKTLFQTLCALKTLQFDRCDEIFDPSKWEGLECPVSMKSLIIQNFFHLTQLPENGWPTTIKFLRFHNLLQVKALPEDLNNLTTLRGLKIDGCPKLMSLPKNGLPPMLEYLHICDCRLLAKQCKKNKGKDWHKIAHVPHLKMN